MSRSSDSSNSSGGGGRVSGGGVNGWAPRKDLALSPTTLLKKHKLPIAAYLHTPETPPGLDVSRPLMLYDSYVSTKVRAVSLRMTRDGVILPVGPTLVIPDAYTGWFSLVNSKGLCATHFNTIDAVAAAQVPFFLTRFDIPAYMCDEEEDGRTAYHRTVVQSGHVLKLLGIFEDLNAHNRRSSLTDRGANGDENASNSGYKATKYAQCLNYKNEVLFVPATATGRFYATATKNNRKTSSVFLLPQILKNFKLPVSVRLVCGFMPRVPHNFTGLLRLEKSQKESVILCCTMTSEASATLLEMDVGSYFLLTPVLDTLFQRSPIYLKTQTYCEDEADSWRRQIKVTHHVTEDSSGSSLGRSTSGDNNTFDSSKSSRSTESGVKQLSLSRLVDFSKRSSRVREKSRTRETILREHSPDKMRLHIQKYEKTTSQNSNSSRDKKEIKRDKSKDGKKKEKNKERSKVGGEGVRGRVIDRFNNMSKNTHQAVNEEFISIKMNDTVIKDGNGDNLKSSIKVGEKGRSRKVTKQNTYVFPPDNKHQDRKKSANSSISSSSDVGSVKQALIRASLDNQDYSTVIDAIGISNSNPRHETTSNVSEEDLYAEIVEGKFISDARSGIVKASRKADIVSRKPTHLEINNPRLDNTNEEYDSGTQMLRFNRKKEINNRVSRFWRTNVTEVNNFNSGSSTEEEEKFYSFTLLKNDVGGCYNKMDALGTNDSIRSQNSRRSNQSYC